MIGKRIAGHAGHMTGLRRARQLERRRLVVCPTWYSDFEEKSKSTERPGYSIPNPMLSDRQAIRYAHQDLPALANLELWREKHLIEDAVASNPQHPWLKERYQHIIGEERRRQVHHA